MTNGDTSQYMRCKKSAGFTLIELVVVISVISLLLTIAMPRYFASLDRGKITVQQQNLMAIRDAIDKFYGDNNRYPNELNELVAKRYLRAIPVDPLTEEANWKVISPKEETTVFDVESFSKKLDAPDEKSKP
jgi:general secretion pathway protein G